MPQSQDVIVGIDMRADESKHPALEKGQNAYGPLLAARKKGVTHLRATMHAGELGLKENVRDAIVMGVDRIGHGVKLQEDPVTLEYAVRKCEQNPEHCLGIEANLISNLRLKVVDSIEKHPFLDFLRLGLRVSLATDNEGIFHSSISEECLQAVQHTDVEYSELKQMAMNSLLSSFLLDGKREELLAQLRKSFQEFELDWQDFRK